MQFLYFCPINELTAISSLPGIKIVAHGKVFTGSGSIKAMHNAGTVVLRSASNCMHLSSCQLTLRSFQPFSFRSPTSILSNLCIGPRPLRPAFQPSRHDLQRRPFSQSARVEFRSSAALQLLKPYGSNNKPERGLKFEDGELDKKQLGFIFGRNTPSKRFGNRLLRVLHGRRTDGTLDLPLPADIEADLDDYPTAVEDGLQWLRKSFPIDEDAAIMARIEREEDPEEKDNPSELMQRGQDLGLYRGPQSGHYHAELSDREGDVYGRSELDRMRAENLAEAEREEREMQEQIDMQQAKAQEEQTKALAQRPDQGLTSAQEIRPPNEFEKWRLKARNRASSKLTIDSPAIAQTSTLRRLMPSFILVSLLTTGCYLFSQYWERPKQAERFMPTVSLSWATISTIIGINITVFLAWRWPGCWKFLNKYFINVPGYPYALSLLGSMFSHQTLSHLAMNMVPLAIFGLPLHEEVGRGTFLAIFLSSGLVGGFVSLAKYSIQKVFITTTLGASGGVFGVVSAYLTLHSE